MSPKSQPMNSFTIDANHRVQYVVADSSGAVNDLALGTLPGPELLAIYNANCGRVGRPAVARFADRETGAKRIWALVDLIVAHEGLKVRDTVGHKNPPPPVKDVPKAKPRAEKPSPAERFAAAKANPKPPRGQGTRSLPGDEALPLREGSKQLKLATMLAAEGGATMAQLMKGLNWNEATVRSGFYWDLKRKGFGVLQDGERFHLVFPKGTRSITVLPLKKRGEA